MEEVRYAKTKTPMLRNQALEYVRKNGALSRFWQARGREKMEPWKGVAPAMDPRHRKYVEVTFDSSADIYENDYAVLAPQGVRDLVATVDDAGALRDLRRRAQEAAPAAPAVCVLELGTGTGTRPAWGP